VCPHFKRGRVDLKRTQQTLAQTPGPDLAYRLNRLIRACSTPYTLLADSSMSRQGGQGRPSKHKHTIMFLGLRQELRLTQQLVMTPQLQQAIKLLQLCRLELLDAINEEVEENPVLQEVTAEVDAGSDAGGEPITAQPEPPALEPVTVEETAREDIDWSNYLGEYNTPGHVHFEAEKREAPEYENFVARRESLNEHLMWQLLLSLPSRGDERIGSAIIGNLNKDGYLQATVDEIATLTEADTSEVESVLSKMQSFDPPGVCARDLSECLLIQVRQLRLQDSIVVQIIRNHLKHLENKNYKAISRVLGIGLSDVLSAVEIITSMEPKPGRQFSDEAVQRRRIPIHKPGCLCVQGGG